MISTHDPDRRRLARVLSILPGLAAASWLAASAPGARASTFKEIPADRGLIAELRSGGFVLYMRHANTDSSRQDAVPIVDASDCSTQRTLSEEGRELSVRLGRYFRIARIPVAEVVHSPLCRARDTARLAFGPLFVPTGAGIRSEPGLMYSGNLTRAQKAPILAATRRVLSAPVEPGANRVAVAHAPNLADLIGYYVKPEGTVVVFRPRGEAGFEYVASIPPALWPTLLD